MIIRPSDERAVSLSVLPLLMDRPPHALLTDSCLLLRCRPTEWTGCDRSRPHDAAPSFIAFHMRTQLICLAAFATCQLVAAQNCSIGKDDADPSEDAGKTVGQNCFNQCPVYDKDGNLKKDEVLNLKDDTLTRCGQTALKNQNKKGTTSEGPGCPIPQVEGFFSFLPGNGFYEGMCCMACSSTSCGCDSDAPPSYKSFKDLKKLWGDVKKKADGPKVDKACPAKAGDFYWSLTLGGFVIFAVVFIVTLLRQDESGGATMTRLTAFGNLIFDFSGDVLVIATLIAPPDCLGGLQDACAISEFCCEPLLSYNFKLWLAVAKTSQRIIWTGVKVVYIAATGSDFYTPASYTNHIYPIATGVATQTKGIKEEGFWLVRKWEFCFHGWVSWASYGSVCWAIYKAIYGAACGGEVMAVGKMGFALWWITVTKAPELFCYWLAGIVGFFDFWTICIRGCDVNTSKNDGDNGFAKAYRWLYFACSDGYSAFFCCKSYGKDSG